MKGSPFLLTERSREESSCLSSPSHVAKEGGSPGSPRCDAKCLSHRTQSILKFWANVQGLRCSGRVLNMYGNEVILTGTRYSKRTGLDTAIVSLVGGTLKN